MKNHHRPSDRSPVLPLSVVLGQSLLILTKGRGDYFLHTLLRKIGALNGIGKYPFFDGYIYIPLKNFYTLRLRDFTLYQGLREINFANAIYANLEKFTLVDCGAAFGQISMRLAKLCPGLDKIVAIDPNLTHCQLLEKNLSQGNVAFEVLNIGVSDFTGRAEIVFPNGPDDPYSAYIQQKEDGTIEIKKIDDIQAPSNQDLALKIDVEGEEIAVIQGARNTIKAANKVCLFVEIHPTVLRRKSQTGEQILLEASKIRGFKWMLAEQPTHVLDENRPFFDQVAETRQYDVIGVST